MGRLYRCLRAVVRAVTPRMTTTWEEPFSGNPSVFVCNHVGAFGPIDMVVKFPLRDEVRVWCNEGDRKSTRLNSSHSSQSRMPSSA